MKEVIILTGIPASGKSTFLEKYFSDTHKIVSLDLIKTRRREKNLLMKYISEKLNIIIDNTNPSVSDRRRYINLFKTYNYTIICYYLNSIPDECKIRNNNRIGKKKVPEVAIDVIYSELQTPDLYEGFDKLYYVKIENNKFIIEKINNGI